MRLAFTLGLTNDDQVTVLKDHNAPLREHKAALSSGEYKGEYKDVFILETTRSTKRKRFSIGGHVNRGAVLPVASQTKKRMSDAAAEMKGGTRGKPEGSVNFEKASQTVAEQQGRTSARKRTRKGKAKKSAAKKPAAPPPPLPKEDDNKSGGDSGPSL
jgi:hypothetical protein